MTRFLFITDTHIGADMMEFHQQIAYPAKVEQLLFSLKELIDQNSIDFVIHGGDLLDTCQQKFIQEAVNLFRFSVPTYLCLGNHDLDHPNALNIWLSNASQLFKDNSPNYEIVTDTCVIHVIPNQWERGREYYWGSIQDPYFSSEQLKQLESNLQRNSEKVHILVTHSPVFGMSTEQSGLTNVIHEPPAFFQNTIRSIVKRHPHLKLVLSGHNHLNTLKRTKDGIYITGSSFIEAPFEYKMVEVEDSYIKMTTSKINHAKLDFEAKYNHDLSYVQGREQDRSCLLKFD